MGAVTYEQLPQHWRDWLSARVTSQLGAGAFPVDGVRLRFEDGSEASFNYAFFVEDRARKELAVFTEHCGYHVFPMASLEAAKSGP